MKKVNIKMALLARTVMHHARPALAVLTIVIAALMAVILMALLANSAVNQTVNPAIMMYVASAPAVIT